MTQDEIIQMAVQAGMAKEIAEVNIDIVEAFAKLIAAKEREACAKVCEDASTPNVGELQSDGQWGAFVCAVAIRARGEQT